MDVTSAQRKFSRGIEQVKSLLAETEAFVGMEAYLFDREREVHSANEVLYRCYATEVTAPPDNWPLLAGEAIHNLRSALDHAVWSAWRGVEENTGDGDHTQFVICTDPRDFKKVDWRLKGVPEPIRTLLEKAQPYNRYPEAPAQDTLAILSALSNADKHRSLAVVASAVDFEAIGYDLGATIEDWKPATGKRLGEGKTEISSFALRSLNGEALEMNVQPQFAYDVRIEGSPIGILGSFGKVIFEILTEVETGFRPHPFATYPI